MTYQELLQAVEELTPQERLSLLQVLARSVRLDLAGSSRSIPLSDLLYGILRPDGTPPTDDKIREDYTDYLLRKYA